MAVKIQSKLQTQKALKGEIEREFIWECPCCARTFQDSAESESEFIKKLIAEGVRYVTMNHMQGVFCLDCYNDPEVQDSTL